MRKVAICLLIIPIFCGAQDAAVRWGRSVQMQKKSSLPRLAGFDGRYIYLLRHQSSGILNPSFPLLEQYNAGTLERMSSTPIMLPLIQSHEAKYLSLLYADKRLWLFSTLYRKEQGRISAYATELGPSGRKMQKPIQLFERNGVKLKNKGYFELIPSADSSNFLLYYNLPYHRDSTEQMICTVFNDTFSRIASMAVNLPHQDEDCSILQILLAKDGKVAMLVQVKKMNDISSYTVVIVDLKKGRSREIDINPTGCRAEQVRIRLASGSELLVAGFCSEGNSFREGINAAFYAIIDMDSSKIKNSCVAAFSKEDMLKFLTRKQVEKGHKLEDIHLRNIFARRSSGVIITGEEQYYRQTCVTDPRTGLLDCSDNYYYNDIIALEMDSSGSIRWLHRIPKRQYSGDEKPLFASFIAGMSGDDLYIVFNDDPRNLNTGEDERPKIVSNPQRSMAILAHLYRDGSAEKRPLFGSNAHSLLIFPKASYPISDDLYILYSDNRRMSSIGRLEFH
ncbi:MAG: hypothetical protein ACE5DN_00015 [Flavobacteriales bacterium]